MVKSYEDETRILVSKMFGRPSASSSPQALGLRTAIVEHNKETTYVIPGDWPPVDGSRWFVDRKAPSGGTDVHCLLDGSETFAAFREAMMTAELPSHFIVLLGWSLNVHTPMTPPDSPIQQSFLDVVRERAARGVSVRVLLWDNPFMTAVTRNAAGDIVGADEDGNPLAVGLPVPLLNANAKLALEKLRTSEKRDVYCNLDDNTKGSVSTTVASVIGNQPGLHSYGAHHQKILLVYGTEGLIGFCGGIDIDPNRISWLHDVHVRVKGAAAEELWKIAERRWAASRDDGKLPSPVSISGLAPTSFRGPAYAPYLVNVVQTIGNPAIAKSTPNTLWPAIQEALRRATRFIYIEDQYFWSLDLVDELIVAAERVEFITVVLPPPLVSEFPHKKHEAIRELVKRGGAKIKDKIRLYHPKRDPHNFIHAKCFVVDDEYAIVTSANANNRGYFLDSEVAACIAERASHDKAGSRRGAWFSVEGNLARRLRIRLWAEHLGLAPEEMFDWHGAHVHWLAIPDSADIMEYVAKNLKKLQEDETARREWQEEKADAEADGEPFTKPEPEPRPLIPGEDEKPWWSAPLEDWAPEAPREDVIVDPRSGTWLD